MTSLAGVEEDVVIVPKRSILLNGVVEHGWARLAICTSLLVVDVDLEILVRAALEKIFSSRIGNSGEE